MSMTSRQRIAAVLEHRLPDRVPLAELWIAPAVVRAILPHGGGDGNELAEYLDMDMVSVHDDDLRGGRSRVGRPAAKDLPRQVGRIADQLPRRSAGADETGPHRDRSRLGRHTCRPTRPIRRSSENFAGLPKSTPMAKRRSVAWASRAGRRPFFSAAGWKICSWISPSVPHFVKDLMKIGTEYYRELYRLAAAAGADLVLLGDDYSNKTGTDDVSPSLRGADSAQRRRGGRGRQEGRPLLHQTHRRRHPPDHGPTGGHGRSTASARWSPCRAWSWRRS